MSLVTNNLDSKGLFTQLQARCDNEQDGISAMRALTREIPYKVTSIREAYSDATRSDIGTLTPQQLAQKAEEFNAFYKTTQKVLFAVKELRMQLKNARNTTEETLKSLSLKHLAFLDSSVPALYERLEGYLKIFKTRCEELKKIDLRMTAEVNILTTDLNYLLDVVNAKEGIQLGLFGRLRGPTAIEVYNAHKEAKEKTLQEAQKQEEGNAEGDSFQELSASQAGQPPPVPNDAADGSLPNNEITGALKVMEKPIAPPILVENDPKAAKSGENKEPPLEEEPVLVQTSKPQQKPIQASPQPRQNIKPSVEVTSTTKVGEKKNDKEEDVISGSS